MSFIQSKKFDYEKFTSYLEKAEKTNQWSNYGHAVQTLENRATAVVHYVLRENKTPLPIKEITKEFNPKLRTSLLHTNGAGEKLWLINR